MTSSLFKPFQALFQVASDSMPSAPAPGVPEFFEMTPSGNPGLTSIELSFRMAMAAGTGAIYITDGTAQTVIDRTTGLPTMRIVGATDTHLVDRDSLQFYDDEEMHTVTIEVSDLLPGTTYNVFIAPGALTSAGGEPFAGFPWYNGPISFPSGEVPADTDTTPPSASSAQVVNLPGAYGAGSIIEIRVALSEPVSWVSEGTPELLLNNGGAATFDRFENNGTQMVFEYTVVAGDDVTELDIDDYSSLIDSVADASGLKLDEDHIDFRLGLGNAAPDSSGSDIRIDTTAPESPAIPLFDRSSDTGTVGDYITADKTPVVTGSGSWNDTVELYRDGALVDSVQISEDGTWTIASQELADALYRFTVKHKDAVGNYSEESDDLAITIDTHANAPGVPVLDAASDSGVSSSDGITKESMPTFTGSGAEAGAIISLYAKIGATTKDLGTVTADASGGWTLTLDDAHALSNGSYAVWATQTDVAGNLSVASEELAIEIDTSAPAITNITPIILVGQKYKFEFSDVIDLGASITGVSVRDALNNSIAGPSIEWKVETESGHSHSVLEISGIPVGIYSVHFNHGTVVNVVGVNMASPLLDNYMVTVSPAI